MGRDATNIVNHNKAQRKEQRRTPQIVLFDSLVLPGGLSYEGWFHLTYIGPVSQG